jgi:apolipoprotein N-acyltransferase
MTSKTKLFLAGIGGGILLCLSWPVGGFAPLLFFAFLPLLFIEDVVFNSSGKYRTFNLFLFSWPFFILWNLGTSWWIWNASPGGAIAAILENSLSMCITFLLAHVIKKKIALFKGNPFVDAMLRYNLVFVTCWLAFEYLNHNWDLAYPWLSLGNGMAGYYKFIQWYEYTGVLGGSLWVLLVNVFIFAGIRYSMGSNGYSVVFGLIVVPVIISLGMYYTREEGQDGKNASVKVVVVQPNIDPYNEKFNGSFEAQLDKMLQLAIPRLDSSVNYLVFPETALTEELWENELKQSQSILTLQGFLKKYPRLVIITGASTSRFYNTGEELSETAQKFREADGYYDNYNTALELDPSGTIQVYHKSKLVPGVEKMPFPILLRPLEKLAINMGGTTGSLGMQRNRLPFVSPDSIRVAPAICYESVFGEFMGAYIRNGARLIFIITNDGWWGDTPGYQQHLVYGRLRAIETRRCIARSANTGISCFINEKGDIQQATSWWQSAVISANLSMNTNLTFYVKHGDYIGRMSVWCLGALLLLGLAGGLLKVKK